VCNSDEYCHSCPSELVSPKREYLKLVLILFELLAQATNSGFERGIVSLKREWPAQARVARPNKPSRKPVVLSTRILVQARDFSFGRVVISPKRASLA